jgi:hypothetical protein
VKCCRGMSRRLEAMRRGSVAAVFRRYAEAVLRFELRSRPTQTLNVDFRLLTTEINGIAAGEIRMEEATGWGSLSYICRPAQRRPPRRQMTVGRLLAAIHLTVAAFFPQIWQAGPEAKTLKSHRPPHCRSAVRDRLPTGATGTKGRHPRHGRCRARSAVRASPAQPSTCNAPV